MKKIHKLENAVQRYPWGSADGIERSLGVPNPSGAPAAELWMGAHPLAPSTAIVEGNRVPLDRLIAAEPESCLGPAALRRFGPALPFLFKALSAAKALSIQAHPGKRKAERGYDREELQGIPLDAPERNYKDRNHKPEMAVALTRFEGLCGFRPIDEIVDNIRLVAPAEHERVLGRLLKSTGRIELSVFFYSFVSLGERERLGMLATAIRRIHALLQEGRLPPDRREAFAWVLKLDALYHRDIGILAPLILNHLVFEPGEAVYIAPGELHAYLEGTALEIMANSDNVVRGALTSKHVDLPELVSVLSFDSGRTTPELPLPRADEPREALYAARVPDFAISRLDLDGRPLALEPSGPEILLCVEGEAELRGADGSLGLRRGESAFVRADAGRVELRGPGRAFRARLPEDSALPAPAPVR